MTNSLLITGNRVITPDAVGPAASRLRAERLAAIADIPADCAVLDAIVFVELCRPRGVQTAGFRKGIGLHIHSSSSSNHIGCSPNFIIK